MYLIYIYQSFSAANFYCYILKHCTSCFLCRNLLSICGISKDLCRTSAPLMDDCRSFIRSISNYANDWSFLKFFFYFGQSVGFVFFCGIYFHSFLNHDGSWQNVKSFKDWDLIKRHERYSKINLSFLTTSRIVEQHRGIDQHNTQKKTLFTI